MGDCGGCEEEYRCVVRFDCDTERDSPTQPIRKRAAAKHKMNPNPKQLSSFSSAALPDAKTDNALNEKSRTEQKFVNVL